jgi:hypothetical protein
MRKFSIDYATDFRSLIKSETDESLKVIFTCYHGEQFRYPLPGILQPPKIENHGPDFTSEQLDSLCRDMVGLLNQDQNTAYEFHAGKRLYDTFRHLSPREASDIGFWSYLAHENLYPYIIKRWPLTNLSPDKLKSQILNHWHFENQAQASLIDHTLSGLWWSFYLTEDEQDNGDWELTKIYFGHAAFRTKYLGQSKTGRHKEAVLGALKFIKANNLNIGNYEENARAIAPYLNLLGGTRPLGYFDRQWFYDRLQERFGKDITAHGRLYRREERPD